MKLLRNITIISIVLVILLVVMLFWNISDNDNIIIKLIASIIIGNITLFLSYLVKNEFSSEFFSASMFMISLMCIISAVFILNVWGLLLCGYMWKISLTLILVLLGTVSIILIIRENQKEKRQKEEGYID